MDVEIDLVGAKQSATGLLQLAPVAQQLSSAPSLVQMRGNFGFHPGIVQVGKNHGQVIRGGTGSALDTLKSLAEQVYWLGEAFKTSYVALSGQNDSVKRAMDIADEGGNVGVEDLHFPERPATKYENFDFPVPGYASPNTLEDLTLALKTTNLTQIWRMAASWVAMSDRAEGLSEYIRNVATSVNEANNGVVFDRAVERMEEVAQSADSFSSNAKNMADSVRRLAKVAEVYTPQAANALAVVNAIPDPVQRLAAEKAYLAALNPQIATALEASRPTIRNLMTRNTAAGGGGDTQLGMDDIAGNGRLNTSGMGATGQGAGAALNAAGQPAVTDGAQFANVAGTVDALRGIDPSELPTTIASLLQGLQGGTLSPSATSALQGMGFGGAAASGANPLAGALGNGTAVGPVSPFSVVGNNGNLGASQANNMGINSPRGMGNIPGATTPSSLSGVSGLATAGGASNTGQYGMSPMLGGLGAVRGSQHNHGAAVGGLGAGAVGSGALGSGALGSAGSPGSAHGVSAGSAGQSAGAYARGAGASQGRMMGGPMMGGMPMGAQNNAKSGKVKTVTSPVEEEGNLLALLGEKERTVPGVIGEWVRH